MKMNKFEQGSFTKKYLKRPISYVPLMFPALLKILGDIKGKNILDLGCGPGFFSRMIAKKGGKVVGVDISKKWIQICKEDNKDIKNIE